MPRIIKLFPFSMKNLLLTVSICLILIPGFSQPNVLDSLNKLLIQDSSDSVKIDKLNQFIFQYAPVHPELVLIYADTAINLSEKMGDSNRLSFSFNRKGVVLYYLGDYNGSLENYFLALSIKEKSGKKDEIWREYNNVGLVLRNLNQNAEALAYFNMAMAIIEKTGDKKAEAVVWNNIGISYRGLKKQEEAKIALNKAYQINAVIGAKQSMAQDLNNLGNLSKDENDLAAAINYYNQSLEINRTLYNKYEEIQNLTNLAEVYLSLKEYGSAKVYLENAEALLHQMRADQLKLDHLNVFSSYYSQLNQFEKALTYKENYVKMRDSIFYASRVKQFDQLKTLANTEKEIQKLEFLKKINSIQEEKIKNQKIIQIGTWLMILLILFLFFNVRRNLKVKKKLNLSLSEYSGELSNVNEELHATNEELRSEQKKLQETIQTLKDTQNQLIHSEKMASLGLLAAGVAHEINNPLNFIQGGIFMLETYFNENLKEHLEKVAPIISSMYVGVNRTAAIVTSLNHYSRQDDQLGLECNIHTIIDNCLVMLQSETKNRIEIVKDYTPVTPNVTGNEGKLHQAFLNILTNACHAIENNGTITITTKDELDHLLIEIADTGCGINKGDITKIMDPFFTTKDPGKGTGLGLSITYNIIQDHQGTIDYESQINEGTKVIVKLPKNKTAPLQ